MSRNKSDRRLWLAERMGMVKICKAQCLVCFRIVENAPESEKWAQLVSDMPAGHGHKGCTIARACISRLDISYLSRKAKS